MPARRMIIVTAVVALSALLGAVPATGITADRLELVITVTPKEPRPDVFVLKGRVSPAYARGGAVLQRRNCANCAWFGFERFETDGDSRFTLRVPDLRAGEKKVCYRVRIPRSAKVEQAFSEHHCIAPITAG